MTPASFHFCTYFDHHYLVRGLALIQSLTVHCPAVTIWVLCMDDQTFGVLTRMNLPGVHTISLQEFEQENPDLAAVKPQRTELEYYFTCTPSLPRFVLDRRPEVAVITYLDADLYFYDDPMPLFEEFGAGSIGIVPHRISPALQAAGAKISLYNVAWVTFRRDAAGLACLHWWRERCIEWCYNRKEEGKYGDQGYLDDWPTRFPGVVVLNHLGADLARWNVANYQLAIGDDRKVYVDGQPLIFYHFSGFTQTQSWLYNPRLVNLAKVSRILRRRVYGQYVRALYSLDRQVKVATTSWPLDQEVWHEMRGDKSQPQATLARRLYRQARAIAAGRLLVSIRGTVI